MRRTHRLKSMQTLAKSAEAVTSREVANSRAALEQEKQRLAQLQGYLEEYRGLLSNPVKAIQVNMIRTRRDFVERLSAGIEHQKRLIAGLEQQLEQHINRWRSARSQSLALQRFGENQQEREDNRQARQQQRVLDEVGRNIFLRQTDG